MICFNNLKVNLNRNENIGKDTAESGKQFTEWQVEVTVGIILWVVGGSCVRPQELSRGTEMSKRDPGYEQNELKFHWVSNIWK